MGGDHIRNVGFGGAAEFLGRFMSSARDRRLAMTLHLLPLANITFRYDAVFIRMRFVFASGSCCIGRLMRSLIASRIQQLAGS